LSEENKKIKDFSLIIPLLNEGKNISELHNQINLSLKDFDKTYEIIFVDDGSQDNSFSILKGLHNEDKNIKVIQFRRNFGKSAALSAGFRYAKGKVVITMDADLQDDPKEIPKLIKKLDEGYELMSGWRFGRKDSFSKTIPSKFFNLLTSLLTGIKIHDFNCGLKAYKREVIENINLYGELHRYIPVLAYWKGYKIGEVEVKHHPRKYGKSKYGIERLFKGMTDLITVMFLTKYMKKPLHLFGAVGSIIFLVGLIVNIYLIIIRLFGRGIGDRPLLLLGVLLMVIGFQIISTGLIGEIIVNTRTNADEDYMIKKILE